MVREAAITQEQVNVAANQLKASGVQPTARAVREALGIGSMATVLKFLQVWKSGQAKIVDVPATIPAGLHKALMEFVGQEVAANRAAVEAELVAAQQANGDLITESERQAETISRQDSLIETLQSEKAEQSGRLSQLKNELEELRVTAMENHQAAEAARTEQAKLHLRLEGMPRLESEIDRLTNLLETERSSRTGSEQASAVAVARLEKTESHVADLKERLARSEQENRESAKTADQLRGQASALEGLFSNAQNEVARITVLLNEANQERNRLLAEIMRLASPDTPNHTLSGQQSTSLSAVDGCPT